ncbi:hypothetical protein MKW98_007212 [Papaver atlanticum]|uniref:Uncharacterized protein n=1 Tax=Papaver atlanticum TaxID=357466 RepID=A0AAD4SMR1_9MAGN|nr:hypothetical protein MKW98_007212 [Papaver atlanticum]
MDLLGSRRQSQRDQCAGAETASNISHCWKQCLNSFSFADFTMLEKVLLTSSKVVLSADSALPSALLAEFQVLRDEIIIHHQAQPNSGEYCRQGVL